MLYRLTDCAVTARTSRDEVGTLSDFRGGVEWCHRESTGTECRKIREIITHERDLLGRETMGCNDLLELRVLVRNIFVDLGNPELGHAHTEGGRMPPRDDHDLAPFANPSTNRETIVEMKKLPLDSMPVVADGAVGEHTVAIESEQ